MNTQIKINGTTTYHGLTVRNAAAQKAGAFNKAEVVERGHRASEILKGYDIFSLGAKINGWGEPVEAYRLVKPDGKGYEVQMRANGQPSCNCPDWKTRRHIHAGFCKHALAVKALRMGTGE
jgi:hypothetical protein